MQKTSLKFKKLVPHAKIPSYAHADDAGFDLFSATQVTVVPGERKVISIGLAAEIPSEWFVSFRDKSGLSLKYGLHVLGGVIDAGYRGEWQVIMVNLGSEDYTFEIGDKVCQGILHHIPHPEIVEVTKLSETPRGEGGFGSTGK